MALAPRPSVDITARDTGDRLQAPQTNEALQLAAALADVAPEARQFSMQVAEEEQRKAALQARTDALKTSGAAFKDAVDQGLIERTQNPWYMSAYHKEAAQVDATRRLATLTEEAQGWEERSDSALFQDRLNREVGEIGDTYEGEEAKQGFLAAANPILQQTTAANTARNVATVNAERLANAGSLAALAIATVNTNNGGNATPTQIRDALNAQREDFLLTGGNPMEWDSILIQGITSAAYASDDPDLMNVLKSPDLTSEAPPAPEPTGAVEVGNIDLTNRPVTTNADGSVSTVLSMSIGTDKGEVLIPRVAPDGTVLTEEQAIALYEESGQHLGVFSSPEAATAYAEKLHDYQAELYADGGTGRTSLYSRPEIAAAVSSDQYRIRQAALDRVQFAEQSRRAAASEEGSRLHPLLIEEYGEALFTGDIDPVANFRKYRDQGFSFEGVQAAINNITRDVQTTQSLQTARIRANALDPTQGMATIRLFTRAQRDPLTPALQGDVEAAFMRGDITQDDAVRLIGQAQTNGEQLARAGRTGGSGGGGGGGSSDTSGSGNNFRVKSLSGLKESVGQTASAAYQAIFQVNGNRSPARDRIEDLLEERMEGYLGRNPGDYSGAYEDMRTAAANFTRANLQPLPQRNTTRRPRTGGPANGR